MAEELTIAADFRLLDEARQMIHWTGRDLGFDEAAIHDIKVAATEALANAIEHGSASDGMIRMRLSSGDGELSLEVSGGGRREPASAAAAVIAQDPQRGRGMRIMAALMDEVSFRREGEQMRIRLAKRLPSPSAADG